MPVETNLLPPRYRGPQRIGRGGMGEIFRATDDTLGRAVAIKLLAERYAQDYSIRERFTREALAAARLSGEPNTVTIYDVGEWHDRPFIVMEYLSGGSLDDRLRKDGAQPVERALGWLEESARALDAAHRNGVVHRDVKPANLLLDRDGTVHVADFGIASAAGMDSLTMTGTVLGTAGYLSPEQAQGRQATPASDRYSLGIVAFELLTGERPYANDSMTAEAAAHVHADVPSVSERCEHLPPELDPVFRRALAKDPGARYPSCADFVAELRHALMEAAGDTRLDLPPVAPAAADVPAEPPPSPVAPAPGYPPRRRSSPLVPVLVGALALLAGLGIAAGYLLTRGNGDSTSSRTVVRTVITTTPGTTREQRVTTTVAAPTTAPTTAPVIPPTTSAPSGGGGVSEGRRLTDQSTGLIRSGDYAGALPIAQRALADLQGSGDVYEAYANYNVGTSLIHTGDCTAGLPYLARSEAIQGHRSEIDRDRARCG